MGNRRNRLKRPKGNWSEKIYVAYKPCEEPIPLFPNNGKDGPLEDIGLRHYEDDTGYYFVRGELVCDAS